MGRLWAGIRRTGGWRECGTRVGRGWGEDAGWRLEEDVGGQREGREGAWGETPPRTCCGAGAGAGLAGRLGRLAAAGLSRELGKPPA